MTELQSAAAPATLVELVTSATQLETYLLDQLDNPALQSEIEALLAQVEQGISTKADAYKFAMDRLNSTAELLRKRADDNTRAARTLENFATRMKETIKAVMESTGRTEIRGREYVFKLSNAAPKLVIHMPAHELPAEYQVFTVEPDKKKLSADIKAGLEIPGVEIQPVKALRVTVAKE